MSDPGRTRAAAAARTRARSARFATVAALALLAANAPAQSAHNGDVAYITAIGADGAPIADLAPAEFRVAIDKQPSALEPVRRFTGPSAILILVDLSGSMSGTAQTMANEAGRLVTMLAPGDRVRVGSFADRAVLSPEFTADHDAVVRTGGAFMRVGNPSHLFDAGLEAVDALAAESARRVLVLLTDGKDEGSRRRLGDLVERAQRERVSIFAVAVKPVLPAILAGAASISPDLKKLTAETGGVMVEAPNLNAIAPGVVKLNGFLRSTYAVTIAPPTDGKPHRLEVTVTRTGIKATVQSKLFGDRPSG